MLRERLREMDLRIAELSDYLQISRPTLYKFIECYDGRKFELINKRVLDLFNYISENTVIGKKSVISYILNNLADGDVAKEANENPIIAELKKYVIENPGAKKSKFIELVATGSFFDDLIYLLPGVEAISRKRKRTAEEKALIEKYRELIDYMKTYQKRKDGKENAKDN